MKPSLELYTFKVVGPDDATWTFMGRFEIDRGALFVYQRVDDAAARVTLVYAPGQWWRVVRVQEATP